MFKKAFVGVLAGGLIGAVVVGVLVVTDTRVHHKREFSAEALPSAKASENFVADWRRMKTSTFLSQSTFVRSRTDGNTLRGDVYLAQKPPKTLRIAFGTATLEEPGKVTVCTKTTDAAQGSCRSSDSSETYEQGVEKDVGAVRALVSPNGLYAVAQTDAHCYRLQSGTATDSSTWGQLAIFCFDAQTGALQKSELHKGNVTDTTTAGSISSKVDESVFVNPSASGDIS